MNDIQNQTNNDTWHEGDWEHISIRLTKNGETFTPDGINLYQHEGGHTKYHYEGKWSASHTNVSNVRDGWDSSHEHPVIFIASNSHASYFYGDDVYHNSIDPPLSEYDDEIQDEVDYDLSGSIAYFEYDYLEKLGEMRIAYYEYFHNTLYWRHATAYPNSKEWLGFPGRCGKCWGWHVDSIADFGLNFVTALYSVKEIFGLGDANPHVQTPAPFIPSFNNEYYSFTNDINGFGNENVDYQTITWISIWP